MTENLTKYGYFGWQEFLTNREDLLTEFDNALKKNKNRPIRTSHGNSGEAALRNLLSSFLPQKYGITSGYIIPDIICNEYKLYHYDIIIYDKFNSPILWVDSDYDNAEQGKKRAIPAEHVFSVIEVKSTFSKKTIKDSVKKLSELNSLKDYLPKEFTSSVFFFQISDDQLDSNILKDFISLPIFKFTGGLILRTKINEEMTGMITMNSKEKIKDKIPNDNKPIVDDIEKLDIYRDENGNITLGQGAGCRMLKGNDGNFHFSKTYYSSMISNRDIGVNVNWSYNNFTRYIILLLGYLEGKNLTNLNLPVFGQVFDVIKQKK